MPNFNQLLGADRPDFCKVEWIAREQALHLLAEAHAYLCARRDVEGADVDDALKLIHGAILEIQLNSEARWVTE